MNSFSKQEKTRVIAFAAISLLSVILVVWLAWGICDSVTVMPVDYDDIGEISVDGSDWTGIFRLGAGIVNGMFMVIYFAAALIYAFLATVGAALSSVILRAVALKNAENIAAEELALTRKIFLAASVAQAAVPVLVMTGYIIASGSTFGLMSLLLCWQYPLFMGLIYIKKLKRLAADEKESKGYPM